MENKPTQDTSPTVDYFGRLAFAALAAVVFLLADRFWPWFHHVADLARGAP